MTYLNPHEVYNCQIDPHRNREFDLMMAGKKKLAYLFGDVDPRFAEHGFTIEPTTDGVRRGSLVYGPENRALAEQWHEILRRYHAGAMSLEDAHRERGRLLGYDDEAIKQYAGGSRVAQELL